jgi:hypothetical protein
MNFVSIFCVVTVVAEDAYRAVAKAVGARSNRYFCFVAARMAEVTNYPRKVANWAGTHPGGTVYADTVYAGDSQIPD